MLQLNELLVYALGGQAPQRFVDRLVRSRHLWDDEFKRRLEELAYEFRPDLAVWEIETKDDGELVERRTAPALEQLALRHKPDRH
ncbi:MAG: hypothetical protein WD273_08955 [Trueperaceae bacterium]